MKKNLPATVVTQAQSESGVPVVDHLEWAEEFSTSRGSQRGMFRMKQHLFVNPDPDSKVPAVLVTISDWIGKTAITISLANKKGCKEENLESAKAYMPEAEFIGVNSSTFNALNSIGVEPDPHTIEWADKHVMVNFSSNDYVQDDRDKVIDINARVVDMLRNSNLLSKDDNIRDAIVQAMAEQFTSLQVLDAPVNRIEEGRA